MCECWRPLSAPVQAHCSGQKERGVGAYGDGAGLPGRRMTLGSRPSPDIAYADIAYARIAWSIRTSLPVTNRRSWLLDIRGSQEEQAACSVQQPALVACERGSLMRTWCTCGSGAATRCSTRPASPVRTPMTMRPTSSRSTITISTSLIWSDAPRSSWSYAARGARRVAALGGGSGCLTPTRRPRCSALRLRL